MDRPHLRYKNQTPRQRTWTIHFISVMKFVKAAILIAIGVKLLTLFNRDVHEWASDFVTRHGIDTANRYVESTLEKLSGVGNKQIVAFSTVAFAYSGLLLTEGIGLWLQKRWAEFLTAIATSLFIPIELYELYEKFTFVRLGALMLNVFIVWYLVTRLRDEKKEKLSQTFVKICGITNLRDAEQAVQAGADAIGFNFYTKSPRYITPLRAGPIAKALGKKVRKVGVFVNSPVDEIREIADWVKLDAVQLHGDETAEFVTEISNVLGRNVEIIYVIRVEANTTTDIDTPLDANSILLDTYNKNDFGGTGESFDWQVAKKICMGDKPVYLAGGLGLENVADAIRTVGPFAVDACSKLEERPGFKDNEKVQAFVKAAKGTI